MKMYVGKNKNGSFIQFTQRGKYITVVDIIPTESETLTVGDKVTIDSQEFNIVCELKVPRGTNVKLERGTI